jgi:GT2 family glycosyltransferase
VTATALNPASATVVIATVGGGRIDEVVDIFTRDPAATEIVIILDNPAVALNEFRSRLPASGKVKIFQNEVNMGTTRSLNRALAVAKGDIIIRNDDDDIPVANRATELVSYLSEHPECDIVASLARSLDPHSGTSWSVRSPTSDADIKRALSRKNILVHSSIAFRKTSVAQIGNYDETFRYAQDYDLYLRAMRHGLNFGLVPKALIIRTYSPTSVTVSRRKQQILFSLAARLIHDAENGDVRAAWRTLSTYTKLLLVPNWMRSLRRRLGYGS